MDKQTTVSDHANPVRAMGLVGARGAVGDHDLPLVATLYIEVQKVFETMFLRKHNLFPIMTVLPLAPSPSMSSPGLDSVYLVPIIR